MIAVIEDVAARMLAHDPGVVVRYRLLRDVLRLSADAPDLQEARANLEHSQCIHALAAEQWADGGWGAFHSRSTFSKQKIPSTEVGVERAVALGLDPFHPILSKASAYILDVMQGRRAFPDYHEKNDRWQTGMRLFLASTLSLICPEHPILNADRTLWIEIARRAFRSGRYSAEDEIDAHAELTGATVKDTYLVLRSRYQLNILGSLRRSLPTELEVALLRWLWEKPDGIGYLTVPLSGAPPRKTGPFDRWLASLELLARLFPVWVQFARPSIEWLWEQRNAQGYWDFGPRPSSIACLPLSDNWRARRDRQFDWTTRVLILLRRFCDDISEQRV